jgi:hypothetical protein
LRFKARLGKQFIRLYLEKKKSQKRAGGEAQDVGPEFKPQNPKKKERKKERKLRMKDKRDKQ